MDFLYRVGCPKSKRRRREWEARVSLVDADVIDYCNWSYPHYCLANLDLPLVPHEIHTH